MFTIVREWRKKKKIATFRIASASQIAIKNHSRSGNPNLHVQNLLLLLPLISKASTSFRLFWTKIANEKKLPIKKIMIEMMNDTFHGLKLDEINANETKTTSRSRRPKKSHKYN